MIVGVPKEVFPNERSVAVVPGVVPSLVNAGLTVLIEKRAGAQAGFTDEEYTAKDARIVDSRDELFSQADILLTVHGPGRHSDAGSADIERLRSGQIVIGFLDPLGTPQGIQELAGRGVIAFSMELIPRITRAQAMDALSSLATVAGYKAVLLAAEALSKMFPMMMTAAGTITPAHVFIVGAGVAGLQAIATARRLGAVVQAYDVRPAVKEQVESLGATFIELELETKEAEDKGGYAKAMGEEFYRKQREMMTGVVADSDVVITTASIPGKRAPVLVTAEMVTGMHPGAVIVDLAAERGGNCELTRPGETIVEHGVTIRGPVNITATVPYHTSQMYAKNITNFLLHLVKDGKIELNTDDEITTGTLVTNTGEVVHPRVRELLGLTPPDQPEERSDA